MKPFIRTDQYNFIRVQARKLVNGHSTAKDPDVIKAIEDMVLENILAMFINMNDEQKQLIQPVVEIHDKEMAEKFLAQLKQYVIPFNVSEQAVRKLFPKVKKLSVPPLDKMDLRDIVYLSWFGNSTSKKYIVSSHDNKLSGIYGSFTQANQKGICSLCNGLGEVGMFLAEIKGKEQGTFTKRGNYICSDSQKCNENLTSFDKLTDFIERLKG
ncbi:FusB/FusC family EF-G-binding protein [Schinkia azotoformans]|uniref:FusB/FusC family EF-G-binding protein n=1 Tax=Schinkia azotoformans TaxID=1454 RepID=UPI002E20D31E|nr:FusB/FusC family EF-G-binding protein [Schinkia azotoformans]